MASETRYDSVMSTKTPIAVQGTLSVGDLARYQYYHFHRRAWPFSLVLALVEVLAIPLVYYSSYNVRSFVVNSSIFVTCFVVWLCLMFILPYRTARKQYASQSLLSEADSYTITPNKIEYSGKSASSQMLWAVVREIRETKSLFLLYHAHNLAMILPKRFFVDAQEMAVWRSLAVSKFAKGIATPGLIGRWR